MLVCAARPVAIAATDPTAVRIAAWLAVAGALWLGPFAFGWVVGWISRKRRGGTVTVVLKSGATIAGKFHHATAAEFTLADATVEAQRYELVTINRCDIELILRSRHVHATASPPRRPANSHAAGRRPPTRR